MLLFCSVCTDTLAQDQTGNEELAEFELAAGAVHGCQFTPVAAGRIDKLMAEALAVFFDQLEGINR